MKLTRLHLVSHKSSTPDPKDRRRTVSKAVFAYRGEDGHEYRRAFTSFVGTSPEYFETDIAPYTIEIPNE